MGQIYALACALVWAFAVVLLKRSGESISPLALNIFRVTFSLPLLLVTSALAGQPLLPAASARDYLVLIASGILAIALADTLFHASLNIVGAGVSAIVDTLYSPMVVLFAFTLIGEHIGLRDLLGMLLVVGAVLLSTTLEPLPGRTRAQVATGVLLGLTHIILLALGIVIAKPVLNHSPVLWASSVRQAGALVVLVAMGLASRRRRQHFAVLRPTPHWRTMVPATVLGSFLALILWIAGMKYTLASVAAILNQSSTIWILLLSVVLLHERMTPRKALSAVLALAGVLLVTLR
jgi:drug/metabolite transporter (DMT)-like permease